MPRGVYSREPKSGEAMTKVELQEAEERLKDKVSPLPKPKAAIARETIASDGFVRKSVGVFTTPAKMGDSATLKHFKRIEPDKRDWIEMSFEEMAKYEEDGLLMAYDADEGIGLIKRR